MIDPFEVAHLDVERLLSEWRWLCPNPTVLIARNVYGDLFLRNADGIIFLLDVGGGRLERVADSESQFRELAETTAKREEWFHETEVKSAAARGLAPNSLQCIGFKIPVVFRESRTPDNAYVADLYECVSFLGDLSQQIADLPDGEKVRLIPGERPL